MRLLKMFAVTVSAVCWLGLAPAQSQEHPYGSHHQSYAAGTLFPNQYTQSEIDNYVSDYYDQWKSDWLRTDPGGDGYRIVMDSSGRTTSEAQGFGMVVVPHMAGHDPNAQELFDGLYTYARAHPSQGNPQLMDWAQPDQSGNNSAVSIPRSTMRCPNSRARLSICAGSVAPINE